MTIRNVALVASAQASEAAVNTASPAMNMRLRPSRSAARPPSSRNPPKVSAYAVTTHCRSASAKCSLTPMVGSATLTISKIDGRHESTPRPAARTPATGALALGAAGAWPRDVVAGIH